MINILIGAGLIDRQHQMIQDHRGHRKGTDNDDAGGGGQPSYKNQQWQPA